MTKYDFPTQVEDNTAAISIKKLRSAIDGKVIGPEDPDVVIASWRSLRDRGAKTVYAGHGPVRPMPAI